MSFRFLTYFASLTIVFFTSCETDEDITTADIEGPAISTLPETPTPVEAPIPVEVPTLIEVPTTPETPTPVEAPTLVEVPTPIEISASGTFSSNGFYDDIRGDFSIFQTSDSQYEIELASNFFTNERIPDLVIYLSNESDTNANALLISDEILSSGAQSFAIPSNVNPTDYQFVLLFCREFTERVGFGRINI